MGYEVPISDTDKDTKDSENADDSKTERSVPSYKPMSPRHTKKHKVPKADSEWLNDSEV